MKQILTYSALNAWRQCPMRYRHRYIDNLRPLEKADSLAFGSVIHQVLESWYRLIGDPQRLFKVQEGIDAAFPNRDGDPAERDMWHRARAMFEGYAARYPDEAFTVVEIEREFEGRIVNPATGASSQTFTMAGKADGIIEQDGEVLLLEHKTVGNLDGSYIERLWCDTQIHLYCLYLRDCGYPIQGILYNCLAKPRLKRREGESEEEYLARKAALAAKNKSGKSTAKRQEPETDEEWRARLLDWHAKPESYHREKIYLTQDRLDMVAEEVWEVTQQYLDARRRGSFLMNTSHCFHYGRPCEYLAYCQSNFNANVRDNLFDVVAPHEELSSPDPVF